MFRAIVPDLYSKLVFWRDIFGVSLMIQIKRYHINSHFMDNWIHFESSNKTNLWSGFRQFNCGFICSSIRTYTVYWFKRKWYSYKYPYIHVNIKYIYIYLYKDQIYSYEHNIGVYKINGYYYTNIIVSNSRICIIQTFWIFLRYVVEY